MFRGFLYRSLVRQPGQEIYAIIITSVLWALLHVQYDVIGLAQVFIMGLFLGAVRWKTGSTGLTILIHMLLNFQAMTETVLKVDGWSLLKLILQQAAG
jgi:membrane protease YdiL (CAAX protease family)